MAATIESGTQDPIAFFPAELGIKIFSRLSAKDLGATARVSRLWNVFSNDGYLWSKLLKADYSQSGIYKGKDNCPTINDIELQKA